MDSFAGSEPRVFISFCSDNERNGQPAQEQEEGMDTTPVQLSNTLQVVTPVEGTESPSGQMISGQSVIGTGVSLTSGDENEQSAPDPNAAGLNVNQTAMSDSEQAVPKPNEMVPDVSQTAVMCEGNQPDHEPNETELEVSLTAAQESHSTHLELSGTDHAVRQTATDEGDQSPMSAQQASTTDSEESCSSFIARRLEAMEGQQQENIENPQTVSISEGLVIVPTSQVVYKS